MMEIRKVGNIVVNGESIRLKKIANKFPVRILHVFGSLNRGGAETMIMNIYRKIDKNKVQFDFVIHSNTHDDYFDEIKKLGGRVYSVNKFKGNNFLLYINEWKALLESHTEWKIIHAHVRSTASIYLAMAKKYKLITIAHSHSTSNGKGISSIIKNIMQYPVRFEADYLFACSQKAGEWMFGKQKYRQNNSFFIKNAIDINKFIFNPIIRKRTREYLNIDTQFVMGHVGRFCHAKNHEFLIDIFEQLQKRNSNSLLILVGCGEKESLIKELAYKKGLINKIKFLGKVSEVENILQAIDYFVFPSLYEGFGISVIEAQASGLKCLVSNKVPKEVCITRLVKILPLKKNAEEWVDAILESKDIFVRKDMTNDIIKSGYDIKLSVSWLEKFYLDKLS